MANLDMDKVKRALERMDDNFFSSVVAQNTAACNTARELTDIFLETLTKLTVVQFEILETKYNGYKNLVENKRKAAAAGIVKENKESLAALSAQKDNLVTALADLIANFAAIIEETQNLGVRAGGDNN